MASKIILYDSLGNPVELDGDAVKNSMATAWVSFSGVDGTRLSSYNVASVNRVSAGIYDVTFTTPMDNINYIINGTADDQGIVAIFITESNRALNRTTVKFRITQIQHTGALADNGFVYLAIFGGKN